MTNLSKPWLAGVLLVMICAGPVRADSPEQSTLAGNKYLEDMKSEPRFALVLGNSDYDEAPLKNPDNDATLVAAVLERVGFKVTRGLNLDRDEMLRALNAFAKQMEGSPRPAVALVYYAGHGIQIDGENYLVPLKAKLNDESDVELETISTRRVFARMDQARNRMNIVILDACRNNPFRSLRRGVSRGLAPVDAAPRQSLVVYATSPGRVTDDGPGDNSVFTASLVNEIPRVDVELEEMFRSVVAAVQRETGGAQAPWINLSRTEAFYFVPRGVKTPNVADIPRSAPTPPRPSPIDLRTLGWVAGGTGVASAATGLLVFGLLASSRYTDAEKACPAKVQCSSGAIHDRNVAETYAVLSNVFTGVGLAGLVAGGVLMVIAPSEQERPHGIQFSADVRRDGLGLRVAGAF